MNVFIAGPRAINTLDKNVSCRLDSIIANKLSVLVGDANGVDRSVQQYLKGKNYEDVRVFACEGKARNNIGGWPVIGVNACSKKKDFEFYAAKDKKMAETADCGFMIWNGKSKGTLNNIINMINYNKKVVVYLITNSEFYTVSSHDGIKRLVAFCGENTQTTYDSLVNVSYINESNQSSFLDISR